jgi:hypothetical protein
MLEIFGSKVFPQIRPVWVGDLGTRQKIQNFDGLGLKISVLYFLALSPTSLNRRQRFNNFFSKTKQNYNYYFCLATSKKGCFRLLLYTLQ